MTEVTALSLDEFAALSAKMEAGVGREQALAQAELSPESWTETQRTWLDRMATLATQGQPALLQRFLQQLGEHRHAHALGARDTEIGPEDDLPRTPLERIAPLMGRARSATKSAPPPAVVGGPRQAAPAAAPAQARPPSIPPAASPWAKDPGGPAATPTPRAAQASPAAPAAKPRAAAQASPAARAAKPGTAAMKAVPAAAAELPFRRIKSQPPPAAAGPPRADAGQADGALPFRPSSRPPGAPSQPPPAPAPRQPVDLGSTVCLDATDAPAIPKAPAGPVDLTSTVCLDSPEQSPAPQPETPQFMRAPAAPTPARPAVRPPAPGPAKAQRSAATPRPEPAAVDLFSTVAVSDPDALAIEAAAALPFKGSGPSPVPSTGSGGLPFQPAQAGAAKPAAKKPGSIPPPAGATITGDEPGAAHAPGQPATPSARGPTLPFARGFKPAPAGATAPPHPASAATSDGSALPFDEARRKAPSPSSAVAPMTLKQYAWLSANLDKAPNRARQTLTMLGLTEQSKEHIERYWNEQFERHPAKRAEFERMRAKHLDSDG